MFGGRREMGSADGIDRYIDTAAANGSRPSGTFGKGQRTIKHTCPRRTGEILYLRRGASRDASIISLIQPLVPPSEHKTY